MTLPSTGLLTCKRCGCAITAEVKKDKYIYCHCTGFKGSCGNLYPTYNRPFDMLVKNKEIVDWLRGGGGTKLELFGRIQWMR